MCVCVCVYSLLRFVIINRFFLTFYMSVQPVAFCHNKQVLFNSLICLYRLLYFVLINSVLSF